MIVAFDAYCLIMFRDKVSLYIAQPKPVKIVGLRHGPASGASSFIGASQSRLAVGSRCGIFQGLGLALGRTLLEGMFNGFY